MGSKNLKVLVTGSKGQLGQCLQARVDEFPYDFYFFDRNKLDITDSESVSTVFKKIQPDVLINTAAYTQVDQAEDESEQAFAINKNAVQNLVQVCSLYRTILIHISTDYVFEGVSKAPYVEDHKTNPVTVYGASKRAGETIILNSSLEQFLIIRTSWLYSQYGVNFYKTMLRLATQKDALAVVNDQKGSPTNANDLAHAILENLLKINAQNSGIYHFCNTGETTWYGFACEIFKQRNISIEVKPVTSEQFSSRAIRPKYSVLNSDKFQEVFNYKIQDWKTALKATP